MALISLETAAQKLGVPLERIEQWVQQGLLTVKLKMPETPRTLETTKRSQVSTPALVQRMVDEDELMEVAESLGWLQLSEEGWDDGEELSDEG